MMNPAAAGGVPYRVPPEPNRWRALTLAAVVHAGLLLFLWIGVRWQNTEPVAVEAEVWDLRTQSAAPPAPIPLPPEPAPTPKPAPPVEAPVVPPTPTAPDIALEKARIKAEQKKVQDKKLAEQKAAKEKADKDKADKLAKLQQANLDKKLMQKLHDDEVRRITGGGVAGSAPKATAPRIDSGYVASITGKIKGNIAYSGAAEQSGNPRALYRIDQLPTGEIILVKRIKSSGVPAYDSAVENAIWKSSPLPRKKDGTVERTIEAGFEMKDLP